MGVWLRRFGLLVLAVLSAGCTQLAIANGNRLAIVDTITGWTLYETTRYQEVMRLAFRPDGERLAVGVCFRNRVVELEVTAYDEVTVPTTAASCPWAIGYAPDSQSLAVGLPYRPDPLAALFGHLWIGGPQPLDRDMGRPLYGVAYRPGGGQLAVGTPTGLVILGPGPDYPELRRLPLLALSLGYTTDGSRLLVGTNEGFHVLDAAAGYATLASEATGGVLDVAVAGSGSAVALVGPGAVSIRRLPDLGEVASFPSAVGFRDGDFSPDGLTLAVAESSAQVRLFRGPAWQELSPITVTGRVDAVAYRPQHVGQRRPVVFVHGHSGDAVESWHATTDSGTSFAAALAANPGLQIDAFYLQLPVHGAAYAQNQARSIEGDAQDILALIEGGADSRGAEQVGILNMPAYAAVGRVALVGYSQGSMSSRYYLKNLMGTRRGGAVTVSEFVALAAPNHGVGGIVSCGDENEPDLTRRQLCAGRTATVASQLLPCGACLPTPGVFSLGGNTFILDLNGHPLADSCGASASHPDEAPKSRPDRPDGVLYVNVFAANNADEFVGGATQSLDCLGRRLARNLAPNAVNLEVPGVPSIVHAKFPHHWDVICATLRTIADHQAPDPAQLCTDLTRP